MEMRQDVLNISLLILAKGGLTKDTAQKVANLNIQREVGPDPRTTAILKIADDVEVRLPAKLVRLHDQTAITFPIAEGAFSNIEVTKGVPQITPNQVMAENPITTARTIILPGVDKDFVTRPRHPNKTKSLYAEIADQDTLNLGKQLPTSRRPPEKPTPIADHTGYNSHK